MRLRKILKDQKQLVYNAENQFRRMYRKEFQYYKTLKDVQVFTDYILTSSWFKRRYKIKNIYAYYTRKSVAYGWLEDDITISMELPQWARNQLTILHEIAHGLCNSFYTSKTIGHGVKFADMYLSLIRRYLGLKLYKNMLDLFIMNDVKFF